MGSIATRARQIDAWFACAAVLLSAGYALACSPGDGSPWFTLRVAIDAKTLPKGFALKGSRIEKVGARECIDADGRSLDGYELQWWARFAASNVLADGRPADVKLPAADSLALHVHCDRQRYVALGRVSYEGSFGSGVWMRRVQGVWMRRVQLDPFKAERVTQTRYWTGFCTVSAEPTVGAVRSSATRALPLHGSIELAALDSLQINGGNYYPEQLDGPKALAPSTFKVVVDCYKARTIVAGRIDYALSESYNPHQSLRSTAVCAGLQELEGEMQRAPGR